MLSLWAFIDPVAMLAYFAALLGLPILVLGVVLWLCERVRGKPRGTLNSIGPLVWGVALCLPLAYYFAAYALQ